MKLRRRLLQGSELRVAQGDFDAAVGAFQEFGQMLRWNTGVRGDFADQPPAAVNHAPQLPRKRLFLFCFDHACVPFFQL